MKRTRRLLLLALLAGLAAIGVSAWLLWPRTAITRESAAKVQVGMTLAEVEAILGGKARDETTRPVAPDVGDAPDLIAARAQLWGDFFIVASLGPRPPPWRSDRVTVLVALDR